MNALKFAIQEELLLGTKIKVIGVGGGGSNAVVRMMNEGVLGVEFHVINTDVQALNACPVPNKLAIGAKVTNGLGAGADPAIGRQSALEDTERIIEILEGADMVFVAAGLGGGTGTGAAPVVASLAKELNALTVAVVTKPFLFEGPRRMKAAEKGLAELGGTVDTIISVPNERLLKLVAKGTSITDSFRTADDVLRQAVQGIADIILTPGLINRDFSDIRSIMLGMGYAMMGSASARGENAAVEAARKAISSALMEEGGVKGARGLLINITGSTNGLGVHEVNEACSLIWAATENHDADMSFGVVINESLEDEVRITVIATGFERDNLPHLTRRSAEITTRLNPARIPEHEPEPELELQPRSIWSQPMAEIAPAPEPEPEVAYEDPAHHLPPPPASTPSQVHLTDLDVPAFLRRDRRLYQ